MLPTDLSCTTGEFAGLSPIDPFRARASRAEARIGDVRSIESVLHERGGVARRGEIERDGVARGELARAIRAGRVFRVRKGVYALAGAPRGIVTAARHGGALACGAALRAHGVWVLDEDPQPDPEHDDVAPPSPDLHIWLGRSGRTHRHAGCRCRVHNEWWEVVHHLGIVSVALALLQFAACTTPERFFAALESALHRGLLSAAARAVIRSRVAANLRWVVDLAGEQSESGLESLLRFRLHLLGLSLAAQVLIPGVGRVDFVLAGRIILEVDGRENHDGPSLRHKDLMRDAAAAAQGYETLRFDYAMVIYQWPVVVAAIVGRLRAVDPGVAQDVARILQDQTA